MRRGASTSDMKGEKDKVVSIDKQVRRFFLDLPGECIAIEQQWSFRRLRKNADPITPIPIPLNRVKEKDHEPSSVASQPEGSDESLSQPEGAGLVLIGCEGVQVKKFAIDPEARVRVVEQEEEIGTAEAVFASQEELEELTAAWPQARLIRVWNQLPGVRPVQRFEKRQIAVARIWKGVQTLERIPLTEGGRKDKPSQGGKQAQVIALLKRSQGATVGEIMEATGWKAHSVRGFLSGVLRKRMGLEVKVVQRDTGRCHVLQS